MYEPFEEYGSKQPGETYDDYIERHKKYVDALPPFEWPMSSSPVGGLLTPDTSDSEGNGLQTGQQGGASQIIGNRCLFAPRNWFSY